jgi:hypothetical protein
VNTARLDDFLLDTELRRTACGPCEIAQRGHVSDHRPLTLTLSLPTEDWRMRKGEEPEPPPPPPATEGEGQPAVSRRSMAHVTRRLTDVERRRMAPLVQSRTSTPHQRS